MQGHMTMGALIASSILSGRILAPVMAIPGLLVQHAHAQAALQGIERIYQLKTDHYGIQSPLAPARLQGHFKLEEVKFSYGDNPPALVVPTLAIAPKDRIAILGPIGAGKSTLLRLLSGMYKPQEGRILLDDMELSHISKPLLSEHIGYLQQEGRLFAGTIRENLVLGMVDPGDSAILAAAKLTGLLGAVITAHPKGLQQQIFEGGNGLSGGQRQLVNLTRVFLHQPAIWLLDEPTASLDRNSEVQVVSALAQTLKPQDTLVLVTHKTEMLEVVDRLIVIANHQIIMDGPKQQVLARLQTPVQTEVRA